MTSCRFLGRRFELNLNVATCTLGNSVSVIVFWTSLCIYLQLSVNNPFFIPSIPKFDECFRSPNFSLSLILFYHLRI